MKWMKERDLLIAQTMAFVQSVTGKPPEIARPAEAVAPPQAAKPVEGVKTVAVSAGPPSVDMFEPARPAVPAPSANALSRVQTPAAAKAPAGVPRAALEVRAPIVEPPAKAARQTSDPVGLTRLDLREDFQSEIRARVASFRAHQERFTREREAYCAATMAKVQAALKQTEPPPRQTPK